MKPICFLLIINILCSNKKLSSDNKSLYDIFQGNLFNSSSPIFYNYNNPINLNSYIIHIRNIIEKVFDDQMFDIFEEIPPIKYNYYKIKLSSEFADLSFKYKCLENSNNIKDYYVKLEIDFFKLFYSRFLFIFNDYGNIDNQLNIWDYDISYINKSIELLKNKNYELKFKLENRLFTDKNIINIFNSIIFFLEEQKTNKLDKIKELKYKKFKKNLNFSEVFLIYIILYKEYVVPFLNNVPTFQAFNQSLILHNTKEELLSEINKLLNQNINLNSKDVNVSICFLIDKIQVINIVLFKKFKYEPEIQHFLNILYYYHYLTSAVLVKKYNSSNTLKDINSQGTSEEDGNEQILEYNDIENMVFSQKLTLIELIKNIIRIKKGFSIDNINNLNAELITTITESEILCLMDNSNLDDFFIMLYDLDIKINTYLIQEEYDLDKFINVYEPFSKMFEKKFSEELNLHLFKENYMYFKMQAIIETRLALIYYQFNKKNNSQVYSNPLTILEKRIHELETYLDKVETEILVDEQQHYQKQQMLKLVELLIREYREKLIEIKNIEVMINPFNNIRNHVGFYIIEYDIHVLFYEVVNDIKK
ncbi:hypothetical protein NUSPORA_00814 [Nucleospora cyclopteri]